MASATPRRALLGGALGAAVTALLTRAGVDDAAAKRKKKKKKKTAPPPGPLVCDTSAGLTQCGAACVDLVTSGANCGECGNSCASGGCIHDACTCSGEPQCPDACACFSRFEGGSKACMGAVASQTCATDAPCPLGAVCLINGKCSIPCVA